MLMHAYTLFPELFSKKLLIGEKSVFSFLFRGEILSTMVESGIKMLRLI